MIVKRPATLRRNGRTSRPALRSAATSASRPSAMPWPSMAAWMASAASLNCGRASSRRRTRRRQQPHAPIRLVGAREPLRYAGACGASGPPASARPAAPCADVDCQDGTPPCRTAIPRSGGISCRRHSGCRRRLDARPAVNDAALPSRRPSRARASRSGRDALVAADLKAGRLVRRSA